MSLNSVSLAEDNFVLIAIVEIPAYYFSCMLNNCIGRKPTLSSAFLLNGAFCLASLFISAGKEIKKEISQI